MISVIIPYVRRHGAKRCKQALEQTNVVHEVIADIDSNRIGCPKMVKRLVEKTQYDWVCFLGDDCIPDPHMLDVAVQYMQDLHNRWGMIGLNDQTHDGEQLATHWLCHKKMLPFLGGEFFNTEYIHNFCDRELIDIAKEYGRYVWAKEAKLKHLHPINGGESDKDYKRVSEHYETDKETYFRRKIERTGSRLAICLPVSDEKIHTLFFSSFMGLDIPCESQLFLPRHGFQPGDIAHVRNDLVEQALEWGASHVIFMDTDQVYHSTDMLPLMLQHNKPFVGAKVHRRWPPFDPILQKNGSHVSDSIIAQGGLIDVDRTGAGCIMIKREVLRAMKRPWFKTLRDENDMVLAGEDMFFCDQVRELGYEIVVDCDINIGHLSMVQVNGELYELWKKLKGVKNG